MSGYILCGVLCFIMGTVFTAALLASSRHDEVKNGFMIVRGKGYKITEI